RVNTMRTRTHSPIRFTEPLPRPPRFPSSPLPLRSRRDGGPNRVLESVLVAHGQRDVDRAQHREDEGLDDRHEGSEAVECDRYTELGEAREDLDDLMIRRHVREQADAERYRTKE